MAQDKTHSKKLENVKTKKNKKKKDKKASQYQGKIEPAATPSVKGNPTKKSRKTSGQSYQERIGNDKPPSGTRGTKFSGEGKSKTVEKGRGTRHRGDPVPTEPRVTGNPTRKSTSGVKYQERIGNNEPPRGTKGTNYQGRGQPKTIERSKGTDYKGDVVPLENNRVKGNPTKIDKSGKDYLERTGQQGPPNNTPGTKFAGRGRPKTIKGGNDGTTYAGQSTTGSTSNAGGRSTIYGERGRNFEGSGIPEIKRQEQGAEWSGNQKGNKSIEGTPGTQFKGNLKGNKIISRSPGTEYRGDLKGNKVIEGTAGTQFRGDLKGNKVIEGTPGTQFRGHLKTGRKKIYDYGGDWAGDMKLKDVKPDTRATTYTIKGMRAKQIAQGPGTTYQGNLKGSKKIVNWDGADFEGHLRVKRNPKVKTEGTTFAGNLRVKPDARVKTPGTTFAGHYKVSTNPRIKTEGVDFQGTYRTSTQFFKNRYYRQKSREQQLFAGNYQVRRTKGKDLHPSATYSGGRLKDPNKREDFSRQWKLLVAKTQKNADQPKHLKIKNKKPKYDPGEKDLWYD